MRRKTTAAIRPPGRPRVTLNQLHTFAAVAATEHVGEAAERLRQSQGSVSGTVARLEATLGLELLVQVGRGVRLTDAGHAVRHLAERAIEDALQVERLASGYLAFETGRVTVAAGHVSGAHLLANWLAPFAQRHPAIDLHLTLALNTELLAMLFDGAADIVIVGSPLSDPALESVLLHRTDLVVAVAAHHALARGGAGRAGFAQERHLAHERGTATHDRALLLLDGAHRGSEIVLEEGALHAALLAGLGFAVMPRSTIAAELDSGTLVEVAVGGPAVLLEYRAGRRRGLPTPAAAALWDQLTAVALPDRPAAGGVAIRPSR